MSEIPKIVKLLTDDDAEKRTAAAVVLGALKAKGAPVKDGLLSLLKGGPEERRVALDALGQIDVKSVVPDLLPHLWEPNPAVRAAAERAVAAYGEAAVPYIQKRQADVEKVDERRALDAALARVGGGDAFSVLLDSLAGHAAEGGREAALQVRQHVKTANKQERKAYLGQVVKFLKRKDVRASVDALKAGVKIVGYLEEAKAIPVLLEHLAEGVDDGVRLEAVIALRFALGPTRDVPEVVSALLDVVEKADRDLARAAIDTLTNLDVPAGENARLGRLAAEGHPERARFAVEKLRLSDEAAAKKALVEVLLRAPIERAEMAVAALVGEKRAASLLSALENPESLPDHAPRVVLIAQVLSSLAEGMTTAQKKKLVEAAVRLVEDGVPGYESVVKTARAADSEGTAAGLRALADRLRKKKKGEKAAAVLGLLDRGGEATAEDRFRRAMLELKKSRRDTKPASRAKDPCLRLFQELLDARVDVGAMLRKERALENEERFYLGWHFLEEGEPLGEELLDEVVKKAPRTKLARMAKNKRALEGTD